MSDMLGKVRATIVDFMHHQHAVFSDGDRHLEYSGDIDLDGLARAVIAATRKPSREMIDGVTAIFGGHQLTAFEKEQLWATMVDIASLGE